MAKAKKTASKKNQNEILGQVNAELNNPTTALPSVVENPVDPIPSVNGGIADIRSQFDMQVSVEDLINIPVLQYKMTCEREVEAWTAKYNELKAVKVRREHDAQSELEKEVDAAIKAETANLTTSLKQLGFEDVVVSGNQTSRDGGLQSYSLKATQQTGYNSYGISLTKTVTVPESVLVAEREVAQMIVDLKLLEQNIAGWRTKLSKISDVREQARAAMTLNVVSSMERGRELLDRLGASFTTKLLANAPRMTEDILKLN